MTRQEVKKAIKKDLRLICVEDRCLLRGFTLIELLVTLSILTIVFGTITGIFMSVANAQRKIISMANVQESASFMLESLAKEVRMSVINSSLPADTPLAALTIKNSKGEDVTYTFDSANKNLVRAVGSDLPQAINPDNISVTGSFYIKRTSFPLRDKVTIFLRAESKNANAAQKTIIDLETSMTPRGSQD
jgi:prepilin-type N-terminal cleavage/methylation domain-containing protein